MNWLLNRAQAMSLVLVWLGGSLIILSALLVTLEVILRRLFSMSLAGADELSGYAFGIATSFGFAHTLFERAHIRVDAVYNLFPTALKVLANFLSIILLTGFVGIVCAMGWGLVADTLVHDSHSITPLRTPLVIPQLPWLAGWLYFFVCCVLLLLAAVKALAARDPKALNKLIGTKTVDEQIKDEAA